ncbi:MAG: hypothetical protein DRN08_05555 [Thermoplasmata archaeon]|nr:hypothetical protein [Deltaproteobacteria bacterium]RLA89080.1 MAG: hypothetical protein DRG20_05185 [Deltaproteobacteria bacterium]RLF33356.1 MAG: hypothetical protein DRN08_05555 [Thermoplasmata archaeon]
MFFRTFFLLVIFFFSLFIYFTNLNPENINFYYFKGKAITSSPAVLIISALFVGGFVVFIFNIFRDIKRSYKRFILKREQKKEAILLKELSEGEEKFFKGKLDEAAKHFKKFISKRSNYYKPYLLLAEIYKRKNKIDLAIEVLENGKSKGIKGIEILMPLAELYTLNGNLETAKENFKELLEMEPNNKKALFSLIDILKKEKAWEEGIEIFKEMKKSNKLYKDQNIMKQFLGFRYEFVKDKTKINNNKTKEELIKELKDIIKEDKKFVPAYVLLGDIYKDLEKTAESGRIWGKGFTQTQEPFFLKKMEDMYLSLNDPDLILKIYRRAIVNYPEQKAIPVYYANLCLRLEMLDEGMKQLNDIESIWDENPFFHFLKGEFLSHRGDFKDACMEFKKVIKSYGVDDFTYKCTNCNEVSLGWSPYCDKCKQWNVFVIKQDEFKEKPKEEIRQTQLFL